MNSILRFRWMSDELTFNASDNNIVPDEPIPLPMECYSIIINKSYSKINSLPGPIQWVMNWPSTPLIMMLLPSHRFYNLFSWKYKHFNHMYHISSSHNPHSLFKSVVATKRKWENNTFITHFNKKQEKNNSIQVSMPSGTVHITQKSNHNKQMVI